MIFEKMFYNEKIQRKFNNLFGFEKIRVWCLYLAAIAWILGGTLMNIISGSFKSLLLDDTIFLIYIYGAPCFIILLNYLGFFKITRYVAILLFNTAVYFQVNLSENYQFISFYLPVFLSSIILLKRRIEIGFSLFFTLLLFIISVDQTNMSPELLIIFPLIIFIYYLTFRSLVKSEEQLIQRVEITDKQIKTIKALEARNKQFFTNANHEFQTPLSIILGLTDLIETEGTQNKKVSNYLKIIKKNTRALANLNEQILESIKNDKADHTIQLNRLHLSKLIDKATEGFEVLAQQKEIKLITSPVINEIEIISDAQKLLNILRNIISNAFKYTPQGGSILLKTSIQQESISITVQDNGRGISQTDLPLIFNRYFQSNDKQNISEGGLGIGLFLAREYATLLQVEIKVRSKVGDGTLFQIIIPAKIEHNAENITEYDFITTNRELSLTIPKRDLKPFRDNLNTILIVEDNLDLCNYLYEYLHQSYNIEIVHNGQQAMRYLVDHRPHLILTDIMMPVMDGITFLKELKRKDRLNNIPIIVLTAKYDFVEQLDLLTFGIDDYILKPFDNQTLKAIIQNLLQFSDERTKRELEVNHQAMIKLNEKNLSQADRAWVAHFEEFVNLNLKDNTLSIQSISKEMSVSAVHLNRKINQFYGMPPKKYINERRLNLARRILEDEKTDTVKAVAYSVGFRSEKIFSRAFKDRYGKYPSEYLS